MSARILWAAALIGSLIAGSPFAYSAVPHSTASNVKLSPDLLKLLRAEMQEISGGVQKMAFSIASADWKSIQETSAKIRASYIMEKKLTPGQAAELEMALPERFKALDAEFHDRAGKVGAAAASHDAELVVFQYSRMLESCTRCHSEFAKARFPSFSSQPHPLHHH